MLEDTNNQQNTENNTATNALTEVNSNELSVEATKILNEIIAETDISKTKDLTYLFNLNQTKKTMIRVNKQSELLDALTEQTIKRVKDKPDELSNEDLTRLMKTVSDLIDKGVGQINRGDEAPLIQFNQQNNDINMDGNSGLSRESRDKVKNAVMNLLKNMASVPTDDTIDADSAEEDNY